MKQPIQATIVITSYNRKDDLRKAVKSALTQDIPCEILVMDDGSRDGSAEMLSREFPGVRVVRSESNLGLIAQRSRAAALAVGEILFSIDDDAEFSGPSVVRETLRDFDQPAVGAVAIPLINVKVGPEILQKAPDNRGIYSKAYFIGTAYALRKDLFLSLGGFADIFYRQGEERDFCIRMLDQGYVVRAGRSSQPILHYESPVRDLKKIARCIPRNNLLISWRNTPGLFLGYHLVSTIIKNLCDAAIKGQLLAALGGLGEASLVIASHRTLRKPVRIPTFIKFRMLVKKGPIQLNSF